MSMGTSAHTVGYAERNSASEADKQRLQTPAVTKPQSTLVEPPDGKASPREADRAVHELRMANARPSIDKGEKFLFSSCFLPRAASCWSSAMLLRFDGDAMVSRVCQVMVESTAVLMLWAKQTTGDVLNGKSQT